MSIVKNLLIELLTLLARGVLRKYKPRIVAVTGNVGKTSTKDALYTALAQFASTRKSEKSFNSEIGVPLTILGVPNAWKNPFHWLENILDGLSLILFTHSYPEWLVLEVGADKPGDIKSIARWLSVDVVVLTRFPDIPVHVEFFANPDEVIAEKQSLIKALKRDGVLILNADDPKVAASAALFSGKSLRYGFTAGQVQGTDHSVIYEGSRASGMYLVTLVGEKTVEITLSDALGRQHLYPVLSALTLAHALNLSLEKTAEAFRGHQTPPGRMKILEGIKQTTLIDDTYNASPAASLEALHALKEVISAGRKIAILGDMLELGTYSNDEHLRVGKAAKDVVDMLIAIGVRAQYYLEGARLEGMSKERMRHFPTAGAAAAELPSVVQENDVILLKGSQSVRVERVTKALLADPSRASELLVRQEPEWQRR